MAHSYGADMTGRLGGILSFPITFFDEEGGVDDGAFTAHVEFLLDAGAGAVFPACGTGEFASLSPHEWARTLRAAVDAVGGRVPVVAGVGHGLGIALEMAQRAAELGVDGILLFPPDGTPVDRSGLEAYYRTIARATRLPIILYKRDHVRIDASIAQRLCAEDNIVGLKDGSGNLEELTRIRAATDGRLLLLNGMPTAELSAAAHSAVGAGLYSSAVFNFVPDLATRFHRALTSGDDLEQTTLIRDFYQPLAELRDQVAGYAVSLIKTGVELVRGVPSAPRSPLPVVRDEHRSALAELMGRVSSAPVAGSSVVS